MQESLATVTKAPPTMPPASAPDVVAAFLERRSEHTRRAYRSDLADFAAFMRCMDPREAVGHLLGAGQGNANRLALEYVADMRRRGLSPGTCNRRLAALRSIAKLARILGLSLVSIDVDRERNQAYRDTRGPSPEKVAALFADLKRKAGKGSTKAARDLVAAGMMYRMGLRCHEVIGVDLEHYDRDGRRLSILGKGRAVREWVTVPPKLAADLVAWLTIRGDAPGPLLVSLQRNASMGNAKVRAAMIRLHRRDLGRTLAAYGIRPHGLRHAAITQALKLTNGNIRDVQRFSRHVNPATVVIYDDNRTDAGGRIAGLLEAS